MNTFRAATLPGRGGGTDTSSPEKSKNIRKSFAECQADAIPFASCAEAQECAETPQQTTFVCSPSSPAALLPDVCGRIDCPVVIDGAGSRWCWCRVAGVRDLD